MDRLSVFKGFTTSVAVGLAVGVIVTTVIKRKKEKNK